jgi:hypothetical protein
MDAASFEAKYRADPTTCSGPFESDSVLLDLRAATRDAIGRRRLAPTPITVVPAVLAAC